MPSGADLSPLDLYVGPELKRRLKGANLATKEKLMAAVFRAANNMGMGADFLAGLAK